MDLDWRSGHKNQCFWFDCKATSYSADGECSAASGPADPEWQSDSEASGSNAGEVPEHAKGAVLVPGEEHDQLFEATYAHEGGTTCRNCDRTKVL
jgi:hypothetical protein